MIVEIIVVMFFLISIGGFIFAVSHYLKHHKEKMDNRRILKALETYDNPEAKNDNYYKSGMEIVFEWIEEHIGFSRIIKWTFIIIICFMAYNLLFNNSSVDTNTNINNQPSPSTDGPAINNNTNSNMTLIDSVKLIFPQGTPTWMIFLAFIIPIWLAWRFIRGSRYDL